MENIYTNTSAAFTAANGESVSYQELFDAAKTNVEIYGKQNGWYMDENDQKDLFQNIVLKAIKYHGSFNPEKASPKTWVKRIAGNVEKDALHEFIRRTMLPVERNAEEEAEKSQENTTEPKYQRRLEPIRPDFERQASAGYAADCEVETSEAKERIEKAISSLCKKYQEVISLQREGLKPKKMAERLGCSADAAATLLCRAKKALKRELGVSFLAEYGIPS